MKLDVLYQRLKSLTVYRSLLTEPILNAAVELLDALRLSGPGDQALPRWAELASLLQEARAENLGAWLRDALRYTENPWGKAVEAGKSDPVLAAAARRDVETLSALATLDGGELWKDLGLGRELTAGLPLWSGGEALSFDALTDFYTANGCGLFARYRAFLWDGGQLLGVAHPDAPTQDDLVGYRRQREQVEENTRLLLAGRRVNNVLLFGESGTGKSATVKSLLNLPGAADLRLIEIEKNSVAEMPALIRTLSSRRQKFILFIDDLAFDQDDMNYSVLKTILEGGLEPRPDNVAIYATSNRRNLVRQTFSDRAGDEVDRDETIQEKTALADRFGLRVVYQGFTKKEYLELIRRLAEQRGIATPWEGIEAKAVAWDARHPGRSPRTARQFMDSL